MHRSSKLEAAEMAATIEFILNCYQMPKLDVVGSILRAVRVVLSRLTKNRKLDGGFGIAAVRMERRSSINRRSHVF